MSATPKDPDAKVRLGYVEKDSIVWADGREKLIGRDWKKRVNVDLFLRSGGQCERFTILGKQHAWGCSLKAEEPHHIKKRWPLRDDRLSNLAGLSHACHMAEDRRVIQSDKKMEKP